MKREGVAMDTTTQDSESPESPLSPFEITMRIHDAWERFRDGDIPLTKVNDIVMCAKCLGKKRPT